MLVGGISWGNLVSGGGVFVLHCTVLEWSGGCVVLCCAVQWCVCGGGVIARIGAMRDGRGG